MKSYSQAPSGNAELVRRGARWLPGGQHDLPTLMLTADRAATTGEQERSPLDPPYAPTVRREESVREVTAVAAREPIQEPPPLPASEVENPGQTPSFYQFFLRQMEALAPSGPLTPEQLQATLGLVKSQLSAWLKQAVVERQIRKLRNPARYHWQGTTPRQPSMFTDDQ